MARRNKNNRYKKASLVDLTPLLKIKKALKYNLMLKLKLQKLLLLREKVIKNHFLQKN